MMKLSRVNTLICILIINLVLTSVLFFYVFLDTENKAISDFYKQQVATLVSPHSLRENIKSGKNEFILVDVREKKDYINGHIIGAINIVPDDSLFTNFKLLQTENKDKEILIYCYTHVCMRGKKVGKALAEKGIYVKELGIGFNEWKNDLEGWNYEKEWKYIKINDFIKQGNDAGVYKVEFDTEYLLKNEGCAADSKFAC